MNGTLLGAQSTSIASGATVNLAAATGNSVNITGSTGPITSFGTVQQGAQFILTFVSTPTITASANIILPGGVDVICQAGDKAIAVSDGAGVWSLLFFNRASGLPLTSQYLTVSLATWNALVAASSLVGGLRYRVQSAYTFDFYGAKDIIVVADSVNTIQTVGLIPFAGDILVRYTVDSALTNPGTFMDCYPIMALDPDAVLGYVGGYNWKFNAGMPIYLKMTGDYYFSAQVDGQDTSSIIYTNCKALQSNAGVWDLGLFGTYTPETAPAAADDYFTPNPILKQVRLELSSAEIQAGVAVDIPGTSAPSGYFADATDVRTQYTYGTTPYTNEIFIKTSTAIDPQWGSTTVLLATSDQFKSLIDLRSDPAARIVYVDQRQLQVVFSASSAFGDGTIVLFITVQFIKIAA